MNASLIPPEAMADLLTRAVNCDFGAPIADHDGGGTSFTVAAPATGQLFTVTVTVAALATGRAS
jgi:hypothetical protein